MRRLESNAFVAQPRLRVPKTAQRRRRRNFRRVHLPLAGIRQVIFSARWISLILLAMVMYALVLVGLDEEFYLTTIPVDGSGSIPAAEIVSASGLAGMHIFAADPALAAQEIMAVPGVISATVTVSWPNQVHLGIREDSPVAVWLENGVPYWVTRHGSLLPARGQLFGLMVIEAEVEAAASDPTTEATATDGTSAAPQTRFVPQDVLAGALQLRQLRPNIERLYYQAGVGLSYQDGRGWRAYFGTGTDMAQKLVVYETLVAELEARGVTPAYISVANQERPFYLAR